MTVEDKEETHVFETEMKVVAQRISKNLYIIMGEKGRFKATTLSEKSGVSAVTINNIKKDSEGKEAPKIETLVRLACGLGVDVIELLK